MSHEMNPLFKTFPTGIAGEGSFVPMNRLDMDLEVPGRGKVTLAVLAGICTVD
jgi:hypothetical protein